MVSLSGAKDLCILPAPPDIELLRITRDDTDHERIAVRFYNLAHVISAVLYAVIAGRLARRPDLSRLRRGPHGLLLRHTANSPHGRNHRRPLSRSAALHGHRFRNNLSDFVNAL